MSVQPSHYQVNESRRVYREMREAVALHPEGCGVILTTTGKYRVIVGERYQRALTGDDLLLQCDPETTHEQLLAAMFPAAVGAV